jgi:hypothetical protein
LLDSGTNRGAKNGKELAEWIEQYIDPANKQDYLDRHCIPCDKKLWVTSAFNEFLQERSKLLAGRIRQILV